MEYASQGCSLVAATGSRGGVLGRQGRPLRVLNSDVLWHSTILRPLIFKAISTANVGQLSAVHES